jgi:hypothetical protein
MAIVIDLRALARSAVSLPAVGAAWGAGLAQAASRSSVATVRS